MTVNRSCCATAPKSKPRLLDQVRQAARVRHMALSTEKAYVDWVRRFILFHNKRHPLEMGKEDVIAFLTHLAVDRNVSSSTQNQALSALLFLYRNVLEKEFGWLDDVVRAKAHKRVPEVFTHQEALSVLANLDGFAATRAIRQQETILGRHTPVIALTSGVNEDECKAAGMDACLSKPLDLSVFRRVVAAVLRQRAA